MIALLSREREAVRQMSKLPNGMANADKYYENNDPTLAELQGVLMHHPLTSPAYPITHSCTTYSFPRSGVTPTLSPPLRMNTLS